MRNLKINKTSGLLVFALMVIGSFFFLTSANSIEASNSQSITKLSMDLAEVNTELEVYKAKKKYNVNTNPFVGEVTRFAGNFAPRGWAFCNGQLLPIAQNDALFSLLGTTYGGDGRTTFGLPDLRGRAPIHPGTGPGLPTFRLGQKTGMEQSTVRKQQTPVTASVGNSSVVVVQSIPDMVNNMQPSLGVNYIIALIGIYPSRS